jgi:hypothetical protein
VTEFADLRPEIKCHVSVGKFLQNWALMESALHDAIAKAFDLDEQQKFIVCKNIQLQAKIKILRTAISISSLTDSRREEFDGALTGLAGYSSYRNMIAHDRFEANKNGTGVNFQVIKVKGKFALPETTWTWKDFETAFSKVQEYLRVFEALRDELAKIDLLKAIEMAWTHNVSQSKTEPPKPLFFGPDDPDPPFPPFLGLLDYIHRSATPKKDDETLSKPPAKD